MKKIILGCFLLGSLGANAQTKQQDEKTIHSNDSTCAFTMSDGKMMMMVDGRMVVMDKEIKTKNGALVMLDGTFKPSDGRSTKLKNGDCIDLSGKMIWIKNTQIDEPRRK